MSNRAVIFLTHADVEIDPNRTPGEWPLSTQGHERHARFAKNPVLDRVTSVVSSRELKARQGAEPVASERGLVGKAVACLGENDRSATGYVPKDDFEPVVDAFFASPDRSIRGWERARSAQTRIVSAIRTVIDLDDNDGDILIVAHGAVGALLRCHLFGCDITRDEEQPSTADKIGGNYFVFPSNMDLPPSPWVRI